MRFTAASQTLHTSTPTPGGSLRCDADEAPAPRNLMFSSVSARLIGAVVLTASVGFLMTADLLSNAWLIVRIVLAILLSTR